MEQVHDVHIGSVGSKMLLDDAVYAAFQQDVIIARNQSHLMRGQNASDNPFNSTTRSCEVVRHSVEGVI
jgi:hypothetical protein